MSEPLLEIDDLTIRFGKDDDAPVDAVRHLSFSLPMGKTLALVGESGSGKTMAALSTLGLLPPSARKLSGRIRFLGRDITDLPEKERLAITGREIAMVFQEPMTALNPLHIISKQIGESMAIHMGLDQKEARQRSLQLMNRVGLRDPERLLTVFPHQLSGGQRQRVMIAMALACSPKLLIADEPTTALDVTIQAQILDLLQEIQNEMGMGLLLITHDLPMVQRVADEVCVMEKGVLVEQAETSILFDSTQLQQRQSYTRKLLSSLPDETSPVSDGNQEILYDARDVRCYFPIKKGLFKRTVGHVKAVDGVSLALRRGETVGVVGESGSGKTTLGETLLRLNDGTGQLLFKGQDLTALPRTGFRAMRRHIQVVFQDPFSSLSPRLTIGQILEEGLTVHKIDPDPATRQQRIATILSEVGLSEEVVSRYPHQFSGGQRQRIAIARALIMEPDLLILDEPTSALDLSVQAQIITLLKTLQERRQLAYLFISHDLRVIRTMSHHVLVMRNGKMVESGPTEQLFTHQQHPYTQQLLSAALHLTSVQ
ncbi:MAG: ABC transporter ATP-binding protein [Magnetococcales bacterium]|nr:ABC transporter ATP-binding protein [Magnetococcales bacterium]